MRGQEPEADELTRKALASEVEAMDLPERSAPLATRLRTLTPARVGLRRAGVSLATAEVLDFQLAHGRARDAVHAGLQSASLLGTLRGLLPCCLALAEAISVHSKASDRQQYLQRPDLGRILDNASNERLVQLQSMRSAHDLAITIADGLSALAVERHAPPLLSALFSALADSLPDLRIGPVCIAEQGRVAIGDEVARALEAELAIVLIGERPGLSSPDSLGAYITWKPQPGRTTDAERNCISNIRDEGLSYSEAAGRLVYYVREARLRHTTGTTLKDPENDDIRRKSKTGLEP